jgi:predicted GNAT family acetyltransferase
VATTVADNPEKGQFEISVDGKVVGFTQYRLSKKRGLAAFIHTQIDARHEGDGLGSTLISSALDATRDRGLSVLPFCPFVLAFIERHPEHAELVPECNREEFGL